MFAPIVLGFALLAPSAPVPKDVSPVGPAPIVVELKPNSEGKVLVTVRREEKRKVPVAQGGAVNPNNPVLEREITSIRTMQIELGDVKDLQVTTAAGKAFDAKDAIAKIKDGAIVVLTTDGKKVDPNYLRVFKDDTLVLVSPEFVGAARPNTGIVRPLPVGPGGIQVLPGVIKPLPGVIKPLPAPLPAEKIEK